MSDLAARAGLPMVDVDLRATVAAVLAGVVGCR